MNYFAFAFAFAFARDWKLTFTTQSRLDSRRNLGQLFL